MEPDAIDDYAESVTRLVQPVLLTRARAWERLGLEAPPPKVLAGKITDHWLAMCRAKAK